MTPPSSETLEKFTAIVGPANTLSADQDISPYLIEPRERYIGKTALVLRPGSTAEVSQILALANETGTAIVPQGGNTGVVGGQIPFESGNEIIISLSRMNRIREVDASGNTMTVEAGVILQHVQEAADAVDRLFPLSLAAEGSCQIGGNLATNAGGIAVLAYGNARDLVLGLEVVLANGRIWDGLTTLRKDNMGYDLKNLFIGSEGTLGIITAATLKLFPKPKERSTAFLGLTNLRTATDLFSFVSEMAGPHLTGFELLPRIGLDFVLRHGEGVRDPLSDHYPWYVLMELSGFEADGALARLSERILEGALEVELIQDAAIASSLAQAQDFWRIRESLPDLQKPEGGSIKHDVSVPIAKIPEFIERANKAVEKLVPGARPIPFGHFGDGNIHYNVSQPTEMDKADYLAKWDSMAEVVHEIVLNLGGSISAEHGVGRMKRDELARVKGPEAMDLMRAIKQTFDPKGILNPGKVI